MNITSSTQTQYTHSTNKSSQNNEVDKECKDQKILPVDELLDEEGNEFLNKLIAGMSEEDSN
ncbi:MAG: hypothetical protein GQ570_07970 [Helicobacteraceae bacterium]|nr:hypothetical protein [Helicobacteraceae bacterium]